MQFWSKQPALEMYLFININLLTKKINILKQQFPSSTISSDTNQELRGGTVWGAPSLQLLNLAHCKKRQGTSFMSTELLSAFRHFIPVCQTEKKCWL